MNHRVRQKRVPPPPPPPLAAGTRPHSAFEWFTALLLPPAFSPDPACLPALDLAGLQRIRAAQPSQEPRRAAFRTSAGRRGHRGSRKAVSLRPRSAWTRAAELRGFPAPSSSVRPRGNSEGSSPTAREIQRLN